MDFEKEKRQLQKDQSDATLKILAGILMEEQDKELDELEAHINASLENGTAEPFPQDLERDMLALVASFEKKERAAKIKQHFKVFGRRAAIIFLCISIPFTLLVTSVDAFRIKFFNFVLQDHGDYLDIDLVEKQTLPISVLEKIPSDWQFIFYPMYLPEGYELTHIYYTGIENTIEFWKEEDKIMVSYSEVGVGKMMVDSEDSEYGDTWVKENPAIYILKGQRTILLWENSGYQFYLSTHLPLDESLKIAENISFIKL